MFFSHKSIIQLFNIETSFNWLWYFNSIRIWQEDKNPFGPGLQIYTSPDAWRYQSGKVSWWRNILLEEFNLFSFDRKLGALTCGENWKPTLEGEVSRIFIPTNSLPCRSSGETTQRPTSCSLFASPSTHLTNLLVKWLGSWVGVIRKCNSSNSKSLHSPEHK